MEKNHQLFSHIYNSFKKQNFLTLIEAQLEQVEEGKVVISCKRKESLTQQQGFLHGGVVTTVADVACGYAALTTMPEDFEVLTVEFKINLMRPATSEQIIATGQVINSGKRLIVTEGTVVNGDNGKVIAKMIATMIPAKQNP